MQRPPWSLSSWSGRTPKISLWSLTRSRGSRSGMATRWILRKPRGSPMGRRILGRLPWKPMRRWQVVVLVLLAVQIPVTFVLGFFIGHHVGNGGDSRVYSDVLGKIQDDFYRKVDKGTIS